MAVSVIDATPQGASANSYVTQVEADQYFEDRPFSTAWSDAESDDKKRALLLATQILDTRVLWKGVKSTNAQALVWPRGYVEDPNYALMPAAGPILYSKFYLDAAVVPKFLKSAQCEQAFALISADITLDPETAGYNSISVGSISVSIDRLAPAHVLPKPVRELIAQYGAIMGESGMRKLLRS